MTKQSSVPALAMLNSLCQPRPQVKERTYEGGCGKLRDNSVTCHDKDGAWTWKQTELDYKMDRKCLT